jgi:hypothetical protein
MIASHLIVCFLILGLQSFARTNDCKPFFKKICGVQSFVRANNSKSSHT